MRRWFWALLILSAVALAVAVFPIGGGGDNSRSYAHVFTATPTVLQPHLEIDMDPGNGTGPCNPVDTVRGVTTAQGNYQVAICLTSAGTGNPPNALNFDLVYDDSLNQCVPNTDCIDNPETADSKCLDSNPDANAGSTKFTSLAASGTANAAVTTTNTSVAGTANPAVSTTDTTLTDTRVSWTVDQWVGAAVTSTKTMVVTSNTANTLTGAA